MEIMNFYPERHLINLAKKSELFHECVGYSQKILIENLKINFQKYSINHELVDSGSKILYIRKSLESMKQNDLLVYSDSGSSFKMGKERFLEYIDLINDSDKGNLRFRMEFIENEWTTKEIFNYFNLSQIPLMELVASFMQHI